MLEARVQVLPTRLSTAQRHQTNQPTAKSPQWTRQITRGKPGGIEIVDQVPIAPGSYAQADCQQPFPADMHANSAEQICGGPKPSPSWVAASWDH